MDNSKIKNIAGVVVAVILVLLWLFLGNNINEREESCEVSHECFGMP